jgi:hypothetical protein
MSRLQIQRAGWSLSVWRVTPIERGLLFSVGLFSPQIDPLALSAGVRSGHFVRNVAFKNAKRTKTNRRYGGGGKSK